MRHQIRVSMVLGLLVCANALSAASFVWQTKSSMATARDQFAGCLIGDKIYVFGGNGNPDGINLKSGEVFNIATSTWSAIAANNHNPAGGVEELCGAGVNGKFYVFGAWGGTAANGYYGVINFNEAYNPLTNTWTSLAKKPTTASGAVPAVYNGKIYLFGGNYADEKPGSTQIIYAKVEAYNPATNSWQFVTNMPKTLESMAVAVYGSKAYVIGGYSRRSGTMNAEVMAYDFVSNTWTRNYCTASADATRVYTYGSTTPVYDGKAYLVGGGEGTMASNWCSKKVTVFNIAAKTWESLGTLPEAKDRHVTMMRGETLYAIGGYAIEDMPKATVYVTNVTQSLKTVTDNFDDNVLNAMWLYYYDDPAKCWLKETNGRVEVQSVAGATAGAGYLCQGFRIIPSRDFSISMNYCNNMAGANYNDIYLSISPYMIPNNTVFNEAMIGISRDPDCYFYCDITKGDGIAELEYEKAAAASGKLYISYSASRDELYLSNTGTGAANAWKTIPGLIKGLWKSAPIHIQFGGYEESLTISSGKIYWDNFSCTGLLGVSKPYYYMDDFADAAVASFWTKTQASACRIVETGGKFEYSNTNAVSNNDGYYATKTYLDPSKDFLCSVDFTQATTNTSGDTAVWIGIGTSTTPESRLTLFAGRNTGGRYFSYEAEGALIGSASAVRSVLSGKLYISYSASVDEVYLSLTEFGKASAKWIIKGAVKGKWGSKPLCVAIGGFSDGVLVPVGKCYLDNFMVIGERK